MLLRSCIIGVVSLSLVLSFIVAVILFEISFVAVCSGSSDRCAYCCVVVVCWWPRSVFIISRLFLFAVFIDVKEWWRSWRCMFLRSVRLRSVIYIF